MKIVRFIMILAMTSVMVSCSQESTSKAPASDMSCGVTTSSSTETTLVPERPFSNPALIYGSSFGEYFQTLYKTGQFEQMLKFTSSESIDKFGSEAILNFYRKMDFAYSIKLKSKNENADMTTLNYEAGIMATRSMVRIDVMIENDTCKILLKDLKSLK